MTTITSFCALCNEVGHDMSSCGDTCISNCWREILRRSYILRGSLLNDEDLIDVRRYLHTLYRPLLTTVFIQSSRDHLGLILSQNEELEVKIHHICMSIHTEAIRVESLPLEEKNEFVHWMESNNFSQEDPEDNISDIIPDDDDFIHLSEFLSTSFHHIEPFMLCLESEEELDKYDECSICFEEEIRLLDMNTTSCHHSFCHHCIMKHLKIKADCPLCRAPVKTLHVRHQEHFEEVNKTFGLITQRIEDENPQLPPFFSTSIQSRPFTGLSRSIETHLELDNNEARVGIAGSMEMRLPDSIWRRMTPISLVRRS